MSKIKHETKVTKRTEKRRSSLGKTTLISFLFVLFLLSSSIFLVFLVFRDNRGFESLLLKLDKAQQFNAAPLKLYQNLAKKAQNERDYLRLLKRSYQIEGQQLRHKYALVLTELGVAALPDSENLWAYRVSALLDSGIFLQAALAAENLSSSRYLPLKGEVLLRSMAIALRLHRATSLPAAAKIADLSIANIVMAAPHSAAMYVNLARLFKQPRLAWNAALLYMFAGAKDKALSLLRELREQPWLNNFAAGLIAYDNRDWPLASTLLERQLALSDRDLAENINAKKLSKTLPQTLQYLADTYAFQKKPAKIINLLRVLTGPGGAKGWAKGSNGSEAEPPDKDLKRRQIAVTSGSWELYYNLAAAYREQGQNDLAFTVLRLGRNNFPYVSELLLLLNVVAPPDEREYAKSVLAEFISKNDSKQPQLLLAALIFSDKLRNRKKFVAKLWGLYSKFPDDKRILHYLLWYYIGLNKTEEVDLALSRYRNLVLAKEHKNYPHWVTEYMAISAILQRDFNRAQNLFNNLVTAEPSWRSHYNMANIYIYQADFSAAIRQLRKALKLVENTENEVEIYYRMVLLAEETGKNYLSANEISTLNKILRDYILDNYRIHRLDGKSRYAKNETLSLKLDSLLLWRKIKDDKFMQFMNDDDI